MATDDTTPKTRTRSRAASAGGSDSTGKAGENTGATKPPPAPGDSGTRSTGSTRRSPQDRKLQEAISGTYQLASMSLMAVGYRLGDNGVAGSAVAMAEQSDALAELWMDLADRNPKIKAALRRFTEASAASALVAAHVPIVAPLLIDRGILPGDLPQYVPATPSANGGDPTTP